MTMKSRILALAGACALAALAACGSDESAGTPPPPTVGTTAEAGAETTEPQETAPAPTETAEAAPEPEETTEAPVETEPTQPADPEGDGAWAYAENAEGTMSATVTTAGASLTFNSDPVWGQTTLLRAEAFTADYVNEVLCSSISGCNPAVFELAGSSSEHRFSRPEREGDVAISFRDSTDIWDRIVENGGVLRIVLVERVTDSEVVFEFDVTGADPDFY